jgi:hypothetical protein
MRVGQRKAFSRLRPVLRPGVRYRRELEGGLIFDAASLGVCSTNPTGLLILDQINGKRCCADIAERLQHRFVSASRRTVQRDLRRFLEELASVGLLDFQA